MCGICGVAGGEPAAGRELVHGMCSALVHRGLATLDWLVVRDMTETETASFWYAGRPVRDGELHPRDIRTEVFLMPASLSAEKAGSVALSSTPEELAKILAETYEQTARISKEFGLQL